ncbi:GPCR fungal pheromone mating factor [Amanita muscaria]
MHIELPVVSFICALLVLVPLPWHWRARNIATVSISLWLLVSNLINGVNAIVWAGNLRNVGGVWCDIGIASATKVVVGGNVALPASVFSLCLHLEKISSGRPVISSEQLKRRRQYIDCFLCFGIAFIYMATHYVVQGHRFDIVENLGCRPTFYVSLPAIFLIWVPPLIFSIAACVLSGFAFRNFWVRRIIFARHLQSSNSALTPSHYFRLMSMALIQMFWSILITSLNMWFSTKDGLYPWLSWADVHFDFSRVDLLPFALIPQESLTFMFILWWAIPASSLLYFVFFALGTEARKQYGKYFWWLKHCWSIVQECSPVLSRQTVIP